VANCHVRYLLDRSFLHTGLLAKGKGCSQKLSLFLSDVEWVVHMWLNDIKDRGLRKQYIVEERDSHTKVGNIVKSNVFLFTALVCSSFTCVNTGELIVPY